MTDLSVLINSATCKTTLMSESEEVVRSESIESVEKPDEKQDIDPVDEGLAIMILLGEDPGTVMSKHSARQNVAGWLSRSREDPLGWMRVSSKQPHLRKTLRIKLVELFSEQGRLSRLEDKVREAEGVVSLGGGTIGEEFLGLVGEEAKVRGSTFRKQVKRVDNDRTRLEKTIMVGWTS